ncbi:hypothetical protein GCM10025857_36020 [Alicyclobacillus contaminans]|uniref:SHOCT domain-containing protein n=1 Tax=Alicyclobacillus contaminans TaxID=392016 RepID=UPI00040DE17D|nr:SHOCT domain-containing protein [Alicyclobacillus contaminans]GMA52245.1 hypothetical protein GCM10025857_36020 [Alicyclobacillus contaminans]
MWCNNHHGFGVLPFFLFPLGFFLIAVLCFTLVRIMFFRWCRRRGGAGCGLMDGPWNQVRDAEAILKRRLAMGEITEEEYRHLRSVLKDQTDRPN